MNNAHYNNYRYTIIGIDHNINFLCTHERFPLVLSSGAYKCTRRDTVQKYIISRLTDLNLGNYY